MKGAAPDGLRVFGHGVGQLPRIEIPEPHGAITRRRGKFVAFGVEIAVCNPVGMPLAAHEQFAAWVVP